MRTLTSRVTDCASERILENRNIINSESSSYKKENVTRENVCLR